MGLVCPGGGITNVVRIGIVDHVMGRRFCDFVVDKTGLQGGRNSILVGPVFSRRACLLLGGSPAFMGRFG